ncbi:hypothetical protein GALMADRAFT_152014 [Galerina marginata CBS 339.88]|uniref:Amino acid transporter transmembrane domain-containing protein n=1 Tax=Galerina marginata (strain CBS 339.88) TaxID=685588 RepID=A0A067TT06_GALM3|nr:hypothetical protein GALMADRAFT_152014 [Galerina marginata CBS 339.88]
MANDADAHPAAVGVNRKPPALSMSFPSEGHARRQSTMSSGSSDSDDEAFSALSALDSSAALILVDDQDEPTSPFDFTEDEDERDDDDLVSPMFEVRKSVVFPPLPSSLVFLFLLAPFLKLGALELPNSQLPLKYGLPALLLSALASAFARQIWYMLARYLRKADMTDILLDTFAKGRGKERQRAIIRILVRLATGSISVLLAVTYLRYSMYMLSPLLSEKHHPVLSYLASTLLVGLLVAYLSFARSLHSRRIVYATWLSFAAYLAWLGCTIYAHSHGMLESSTGWLGAGSIWQGLATTAFALCSSSTLPLYTSLKITSHPISTGKSPRSRSFRILSFLSVSIAVLFLLPSVIFAAFPNHPSVFFTSSFQQTVPAPGNSSTTIGAVPSSVSPIPIPLNETHVPILHSVPSLSLPSGIALPVIQIYAVRRILAASTILLGVPSVILTTPPFAIPSLRSAKFNVSRVCTIFIVLVLSMIPPRTIPSAVNDDKTEEPQDYYLNSSGIAMVLTIIVLLMTLLGTFFVPAFLHVLTHFFKRPLAIIAPPRTPLLHTPSASTEFGDAQASRHSSPRAVYDDLLLRKERALQKKQFKKRIIWDIGVWLLLGASSVSVGYLAWSFAGVL